MLFWNHAAQDWDLRFLFWDCPTQLGMGGHPIPTPNNSDEVNVKNVKCQYHVAKKRINELLKKKNYFLANLMILKV